MSNDENKTPDILDDLDAFEKVFNGEEAETEPQVTPEQDEDEPAVEDGEENEEEVVETGDDTPAPDEDDADDEADEDDDDGQSDDDGGKKKLTAQERVKQAVARQREAERDRDNLLARLEALENKDDSEKNDVKQKTEELSDDAPKSDAMDEDGEPLYPLGDIDPKYIRDLTKWSARKANEEVQAEAAAAEQKRQTEEAQRQLVESWEEKLQASQEDLPNVREKGQQLEETFRSVEPAYGQHLAMTIMSLDYGPHVIDYLADNPNEAQDIVNSGPMGSALKLGALNERLASQYAKSDTPKKKVSRAPKPAPTNKGNSRPKTIAPDTDNLDDFEKLFNQGQ